MAMDAVPDKAPVPSAPADAPPAASSKRRRFQFSLKTLLVVTTLLCIWLGFVGAAAWRQRAAVAEITRLGGWACYDYQYRGEQWYDNDVESPVPAWLLKLLGRDVFHDIVYVNMATGERRLNGQISDEVRHVLPDLPKLRFLGLHETQVTDDCLRTVGTLTELKRLWCWNATLATDKGVAALANLPQLKFFHLSYADTTDESLRVIGGMSSLEEVDLFGGRFTDEGLAHLQRLPRLKHLAITEGWERITDAGLLFLQNAKGLESLRLPLCNVTDDGIAKLQQSLPNLKSVSR